jgi:tetratricopeptide (TPR) repeat protein
LRRAQHQDDRIVQWSARDRAGEVVTIPDGRRPSILLLIGSDLNVEQTLQQLGDALPREIQTQVVVIACGEHAGELANAFSCVSPQLPVVVDENLSAADALDVRGWPTILILRGDGTEVARLSGEPDALALKLPPYIELAAGIIDANEAHKRITAQTASEDPAKIVTRSLRIARAMLRSHNADDALRVLDEALKSDPNSNDLRAARAETLLRLNRAADSLALLNSLQPDALPPTQNSLLRARIAIAQEQWERARQLLESALITAPDNPQLHFLMGEVCEHAGDWTQSARHYRAASEATEPN